MNEFPSSILVAIDGSENAALAIKAATYLSVRAGSELHVVHAWRRPLFLGYYPVGEAENSDVREEAERLLERQAEQAQAAGRTMAGSHLREGRAWEIRPKTDPSSAPKTNPQKASRSPETSGSTRLKSAHGAAHVRGDPRRVASGHRGHPAGEALVLRQSCVYR
jgi:hypothetical protein